MESIERMSEEDRILIRESWKVITKNIKDTSFLIFDMIFSQSPDCKLMFPFMKISENGKKRSTEMDFHSLRFMQVLESMVNSIDHPLSICPLLDNLGRLHGRLAISKGFKAHHWSVFIECTLFHFRKVLSQNRRFISLITLDKTMIVWRTLLRSIIKCMKVGLNRDLSNRTIVHEDNQSSSLSTLPSIPMRKSSSLFSILHKLDKI